MIIRTSFWLLFALAVLPPAAAHAIRIERIARFSPSSGKTSYLEVAGGSAIVKFKAGVSTVAAVATLEQTGYAGRYMESIGYTVVQLPPDMTVSRGLSELAAMPQVESALPNRVFRPDRVPNDPFLNSQYSLSRIGAFGAWEYETGTSNRVTIAVIDTGIDNTHPEFAGKFLLTNRYFDPYYGTSANDTVPVTPACNHATHVAGVAAAAGDNAIGVAGVSWGANLVSLRVFSTSDCDDNCCSVTHDCSIYGNTCGTQETSIADAINEAVLLHGTAAAGKVVINMSVGGQGGCSLPLQTAVTNAVNAGLILVAAAGNSAADTIDSPANCTGVIAVGATDANDNLAYFSNTDSTMSYMGVTAPGVDIYTTDVGGGYAFASGTSFSSPMTAGLAALIWSVNPSTTALQVKNIIFDTADDLGTTGPDRSYGYGRINALKAIRKAANEKASLKGETKAVSYPNPFRPRTQRLVTFSVPAEIFSSNAVVKVYTSEGELVRKLEALTWDGKNEAGADVASGIYIFRVKTDKDSAVGKLALIR